MGFLDELRKLTQPYDDDDDFFEGAEVSAPAAKPASASQIEFSWLYTANTTENAKEIYYDVEEYFSIRRRSEKNYILEMMYGLDMEFLLRQIVIL